MPPINTEAVEMMLRDHKHLLQLIQRIEDQCTPNDRPERCRDCPEPQRGVCHGNIEQLIRAFVEATLKHNLTESAFMEGVLPTVDRVAHNRAHMEIAQQLKEIRVVFSGDGNGIQAIEGIARVRQTLLSHFKEHDLLLEFHIAQSVLADGYDNPALQPTG